MQPLRFGVRNGVRAVLYAGICLLNACAAGTSPPAAPALDPLALHPSERLEAVSGVHPIDPVLAERFRRLRLEHAPSLRANPAAGTPTKTHAFWAIWPRIDTGVEAEQVIWPNMKISRHLTVLYAPTMYPSSGACIESTTSYEAAPYGLQIWAWDWCSANPNGRVGAALDVNAAFLQKYTRAAGPARAYLVRVQETSIAKNEWTDYLYNYATSKWNVFYVSRGKSDIDEDTGWDAYETYSGIDLKTKTSFMCGDVGAVGPIASEELRIHTNQGWQLADQTNSFIAPDGDFYCPLHFNVPHPNYMYSVSHG